MKYIYEQPQIQNELLAWSMAEAYHPYHGVKLVAEEQGLTRLAGIIDQEGKRASEAAGYSYVDGLSVEAPVDPELAASLEARREKYEPVLGAVRALGNTTIIKATERALVGEQNSIVSDYQDGLVRTLKGNTSELVLADDDGNFIPEPETVTENDILEFAQGYGYSKDMAGKAWFALRQSSAIERMLLRPERPSDPPKYDTGRLVLDSILDVVLDEKKDGKAAIADVLLHATPRSIQLLRDFAARVIAAREGEQAGGAAAV